MRMILADLKGLLNNEWLVCFGVEAINLLLISHLHCTARWIEVALQL